MKLEIKYLQARYDSRASFYNKATIINNDLYSYDTKVVSYNKKDNTYKVLGYFSHTTARHIREFLAQVGVMEDITKKDMESKKLFHTSN